MFRELGWDAQHTQELGLGAAADETILDRARAEGRLLLTLDNDFPRLLAVQRANAPSVIAVRRQGLQARSFVELIHEILQQHGGALARGGMVSVGKTRTRFRELPLL